MKKSLLLAALAASAAQVTSVPLPASTTQPATLPPNEDEALCFIQTIDNHVKKVKVNVVSHAWSRLRQLLSVRQPLLPDGASGTQWYFDCDGHYIDVKKDKLGKYSVFFRDRSDKTEGWHDQADPKVDPTILREMFEAKYGREEDSKRFLWIDADGKYKSAPLQHAWEIWQHAYIAMSERIAPATSVVTWTAFATGHPPEGTHIIWRSTSGDKQVGTGYFCGEEDAAYWSNWHGDWIAVSDLQKLPPN